MAVGSAGVAGLLIGRSAAEMADVEDRLALLLRFMAVMKGAAVIAAVLLTHWRLTRPTRPRLALGYIAALVPMAAASGLIWSLAHIGWAALLFHVGLLAFLVLAWKDEDAVPNDLATRLRPRR